MLEGGGLGWWMNYFEEVEEWSPPLKIKSTRIIWLNCYGVPRKLWNAGIFFKIGTMALGKVFPLQ